MGMIEINHKGHERGIGRAVGDFKESLECLAEDFEALLDEFENMGERGDSDWSRKDYDRNYDRDYDRDYDERMGERRGRRRRRR